MNETASQQKRLVLHAGPGKTGSTALQKSLSRITPFLASQDYSAMTLQFDAPEIHEFYAPRLFGKTLADIDAEEKKRAFEARVAALAGSTVIVSSEYMAGSMLTAGDEAIQKTRFLTSSFSDMRIILYLRRQDNLYESIFQQDYKNGACRSFEEFKAANSPYTLDFLGRVRKFAQHFPTASICVRPYEFTLHERDILVDFLSAAGIADIPPKIRGFNSNLGFSEQGLFILNACEQLLTRRQYDAVRRLLSTDFPQLRPVQSKEYNYLSASERASMLEHYREDNRTVFRNYVPETESEFERWYGYHEAHASTEDSGRDGSEPAAEARKAVAFLAECLVSLAEKRPDQGA